MMLQIGDKILTEDIFTECFCCDVEQCAGVCCVHGDSGAPLDADEPEILQRELPNIDPFLTQQGREAIAQQGLSVRDADGELVTPLVPRSEECAYANFDADGTCYCAIEAAYLAGRTTFRKPISCHLYPIRVRKIGNNIALRYDRWSICQCARSKGQALNLPVYQFLKEPIVRRFGIGFWHEMEEAGKILNKQSSH